MKKICAMLFGMIFCVSLCSSIGVSQNHDAVFEQVKDVVCDCNRYSHVSGDDVFRVMVDPIWVDESFLSDTSDVAVVRTPDFFTWKNVEGVDWMTPTKHQKNCGSCWDFAAVGALESRVKIREGCSGLDPDFSEQYVLSCLPDAANTYGKGCWGGNPARAYFYMIDEGPDGDFVNGIISEECFPYEMSHEVPCADKCPEWMDSLVPLVNSSELWLGFDSVENRDIIKSQVLAGGPVAAGINVSDEFIQFFQLHQKETDYFPDPAMPWGERLNHIIVICGWKDDASIPNGGYWICKNSWGSDWGYDGFFNIEYGALFTGFVITWAEYDPAAFDWPPVPVPGPYHEVSVDEEVMFDGSNSVDAEGDIVSYHWDFGDGSTSEEMMVSHRYDTAGVYVVTLTVTDMMNQSASEITLVGVDASPFELSISGGLGFEVLIHNQVDQQLEMVEWSAEVLGLVALEKSDGYIYQLTVDQQKSIALIALGLGPGRITFDCYGFSISRWFVIVGPFVLVLPF